LNYNPQTRKFYFIGWPITTALTDTLRSVAVLHSDKDFNLYYYKIFPRACDLT